MHECSAIFFSNLVWQSVATKPFILKVPTVVALSVALLYNPKAFHLESAMLVPFVYRDSLQPNVDLGFYQGADGKIQPYSNKNGELIGDTTYTTRGFLTVGGKLGGEKFYFIVNHWPSRGAQSPVRERAGYQVRKLKEALLAQDPGARIVINGRPQRDPTMPL